MKKQSISILTAILSILAVAFIYQVLEAPGNTPGLAAAAVPETAFVRGDYDRILSETGASFPFYDGFESGVLGSDWSIYTTNQGRVQVGSSYPHAGTYSLLLDDTQSDSTYSFAAAILTVDLSGQTQVDLDFWWDEWDNFGTADDPEDGIFISDDNGMTWSRILSFDDDPTGWRHQVIDLDAVAASAGVALNDHFQIKFQFYDNSPITTDGYAFDELHVRSPHIPIPATFPYYTGFESGSLGDEWLTSFTNEGRVQVDTAYPHAGTYSLLLDDWQNDSIYSFAAAILTVDLSGQTQVDLDFWWDEWDNFGTADDPEDGIFISDDDGMTWSRILSFDDDPTGWRHQVIDLDAAAASAGVTFNDHFQIKFQFYDNSPITTDGYNIDELQVRSPHIPVPAPFPYYTGFESGSLGDEWLTSFTNEGRIQVDTSYPYSGTYSLLLDDWQNDSIYSFAAAILAVDLSGQTQVDLDFWWDEWDSFSTADDPEDGIFISDDDGTTWSRILSFDDDPTGWRHQVVNLDAVAASAGVTFNDHFQIKFQFYDNSSITTDGYAIDDVELHVNTAPTLAWSGSTNYLQDGLHPESSDNWDKYVYQIKYIDAEGNSPAFLQVHILKGGLDIAGSPFGLSCSTYNYVIGALCSYTKSGLEAGTDYTYYFVAQDNQGNTAVPTVLIDAPDVTISYRTYISLVMRNVGPPGTPPILNPIDNPAGNYEFTVSWSTVERATSYTLQEDDNNTFSSPINVYVGPITSNLVTTGHIGIYYYRVKASNTYGETGWSNTQPVVVTTAPPPCPQSGPWSGIGEHFGVEFDVAGSGNLCRVQNITGHLGALCCGGGSCWTLYVEYILSLEIISNHQFSASDEDTQVKGTFTTPTTVEGTWSYHHTFPYPYANCTRSGTWTGNYSP